MVLTKELSSVLWLLHTIQLQVYKYKIFAVAEMVTTETKEP